MIVYINFLRAISDFNGKEKNLKSKVPWQYEVLNIRSIYIGTSSKNMMYTGVVIKSNRAQQ